ncbi:hypothetical protein BZL30_1360 [Mycobacterium kansasii]|uniref:Uncharacterized protein n=1 Tax=Mycobacterium kansasii TaxID=1768 RepID=A0A1V3XS44_MYCKA|nr:hypothetical protein BZL30_1360 [Mycobacterium kansasii]
MKDLAAIATALQELTTRISRDVINMPGPGRTKQFMEELSQLRLHAVERGSTVLRFSKGPTDKLDVDLPEQAVADDRFWEIVRAMGEDRRPDWATDLIAESVGKLVNAIQAAAPTVILGAPSGPTYGLSRRRCTSKRGHPHAFTGRHHDCHRPTGES